MTVAQANVLINEVLVISAVLGAILGVLFVGVIRGKR